MTNAFSKKLDNHETRIFTYSFQPAASPKALTRISREVRGWVFHKRGDKSLTELAEMYNPCIRALAASGYDPLPRLGTRRLQSMSYWSPTALDG